MIYLVKRNWEGEVRSLLRRGSGGQKAWTPKGWVPNGSMEWTGIGGSADWDEIDEDEARAVIVELGGNPNDVRRA